MRIAQRFVAGEVESRPEHSKQAHSPNDQKALDEYACDRSNLPWVIFRAAHRATHITALPARARALLAALARTVDSARPYAPIFARRELLTGRAQQSMRTFYRGLDDLESAGLITRPPQTRYGAAGLFGRAYLHLTTKAAILLGLVEADREAAHSTSPDSDRAVETETAHSYAPPSVTVADGAIYKDLIPTTQKRQPARLPADLQRLLSLGFREFLIFKLMREAKLHGKLLSDVVEVAWTHLSRAKHPISYLRTLLRSPVDFAYRLRTQRDTHTKEQAKHARIEHTDAAVAKLSGRSFVSRDGLRRYRISDDARTVTVQHRDEAQPRVHAGTWAEDFVTALESRHIVPLDENHEAPVLSAIPPRGHSGKQTPTSSPDVGAKLDGLKNILRLKRAEIAPTSKQRETEGPPARRQAHPSPLSSLLQALSRRTASSMNADSPSLQR